MEMKSNSANFSKKEESDIVSDASSSIISRVSNIMRKSLKMTKQISKKNTLTKNPSIVEQGATIIKKASITAANLMKK